MNTQAPLVIGLLNNMPDAVMKQTEAQFGDLLAVASPARPVRLELFALPGVARGDLTRRRIDATYRPFADLGQTPLDALIVTGMEPRAGALRDEPFWPAFAALVELAATRAIPTLWSCLAAHAAVLHLDGIERRRRPAKLSGLYDCMPASGARTKRALPPGWRTPHSRFYDLGEPDLTRRGYTILSRADQAGVDAFAAPALPFLFLQGHPEYDRRALLREYVRDMTRAINGERPDAPAIPVGYFDAATVAALTALQGRTGTPRQRLDALGDVVRNATPYSHCEHATPPLIANWVASLATPARSSLARLAS